MAGPFELEFGFFGQRQQLDEISAWNTCESGDRETRISPVTRTGHTESGSKIKELFLFKTPAYLVQADGFTMCRVYMLPTLHSVHHVLKII